MIIFGGSTQAFIGGQYDVWALNLAGSPQWTQVSPAGAHPSGRTYQSAVWDSARNHMVMFGGYPNLNDLWILDPVEGWSQIPAMPNPGLIEMPASFFDPVRARLVVFGGTDGTTFSNGVWTHSSDPNASWVALNTNGTPPAGRAGASFIYDSTRDRAVLFGGKDSALKNDVWLFDLGTDTWSQASPLGTAPPVRYLHSAIYDPVRDRMVVFGGGNAGMNDTWELVFSDPPIWNQLTPSGTIPAARIGQSAIFDTIRDRMIIAAGAYNAGFGANYFDDVWSLSLSGSPAWTQLSPLGTPPGERASHCATYDPVQDRMLIFGGGQSFWPFIGYMYNDLWELRLSGPLTWNALQLTGTVPPARAWQGRGYDSAQGNLLVFGGWGSQFGAADDTWLLHFSGMTTGVEPHEPPVGLRVVASPNPVLARAQLQFKLDSRQPVRVSIHDISGRTVAVLVDRVLEAGDHEVTWEPRTQSLGCGVYFYDLNAGNAQASGRIVLLR